MAFSMQVVNHWWIRWFFYLGMLWVVCACTPDNENPVLSETPIDASGRENGRRKVLYVNSYDLDMHWARASLKGALDVLNVSIDGQGTVDDSESVVAFRLFNMKTKKNKSIEHKKEAALAAKALIDSWKPDVVICADDNAAKYLIVPYFRNTEIPFVFSGVNWDASEYGLPCSNVTGMIEVFPIQEMLNIIRPFAKGERIGFLSHDTLTEHKNAAHIERLFGIDLVERYVTDMAGLEKTYKVIQKECDILMVIEVGTLKNFDNERFLEIAHNFISIPTVSFSHRHADKYLLTFKRVPEEQGEWAARSALEILGGKSPANIPIAMNKKAGIRLNMDLAKKLGIKFPMELLQRLSFTSEEPTQKTQ